MAGPHPVPVETIPTEFEPLDRRIAGIKGDSRVERLHAGARWAEGPVYVPTARCLLWSDIPSDRVLRWDELTGQVTVVREPSGHANGATLDVHGRLVTCEQGPRRVTRLEHDGTVTVLADSWEGKRLNSPNDVVGAADGSVWFTDPPYGIANDYEGHHAEPEIDGCHVYRAGPAGGDVRRVADDFDKPNGLALTPDGSRLYVADTGRSHIRVFDVTADGGLSGGEVFTETGDDGSVDGVRLDADGRVWAAVGTAVCCYDPDGTLLGRLRLPETASNLVFGGLRRNRLFVTASTSVYSAVLSVRGARPVWATA